MFQLWWNVATQPPQIFRAISASSCSNFFNYQGSILLLCFLYPPQSVLNNSISLITPRPVSVTSVLILKFLTWQYCKKLYFVKKKFCGKRCFMYWETTHQNSRVREIGILLFLSNSNGASCHKLPAFAICPAIFLVSVGEGLVSCSVVRT